MLNINNKNLIFFSFILLAILNVGIFFAPIKASADIYYSYNGKNNYNYNNGNNNYGSNYNNQNNINPSPSVNSVSPDSITKNSNTIIVVRGYGFVPNSVVKIDNYALNTNYINSSTLETQLVSYDLINTQEHYVTVFNPAPGGGYSNAVVLKVNTNVVSNTSSNKSTVKNSVSNSTKQTNHTTTTTVNSKNENNTSKETQVKDLAANAIFGTNAFMPSSLVQWIFFAILILLGIILWRKLYVNEEDKHTPLKHA